MSGVTRKGRVAIGASIATAALLLVSACGSSGGSGGGTPASSSSSGGGSITETQDSTIAAKLPAALRSQGKVTVATDASYPPNEFFGSDNKTI